MIPADKAIVRLRLAAARTAMWLYVGGLDDEEHRNRVLRSINNLKTLEEEIRERERTAQC